MREQSLFIEAMEREDPAERAAFLDQACATDPALRARIERLFLRHEETGDLLDSPEPWAAITVDAPADEAVGTTIGPYKLMEAIGEGGMGTVYVADQTHPVRRRVALKVIKAGMDTRQVLARFEAERQALALMDHPNIAKVHDAGATPEGRPYFVMELVNGLPITDYCDRARLSVPERLDLFVLVCRAVQHAHQKGIIHRDLKPSNILVTVIDGAAVPKVIDFGIAKTTGGALTDRTVYTGFAQLVGTPLYMSPEQAELSGVDVDTRSDVYSLGVLLYELLTGTTPIDRQTFCKAAYDEIRRVVREQEPPTPSTRLSALGENLATISANRHCDARKLGHSMRGELDWIVMKALEKDRTRRYETANDFAADVMRHLTDQRVEACPPSVRYRLGKLVRRHRVVLATAVIVSLALIAGTTVSVWQAARAARAAEEARRRSDDLRQVVAYMARDLFGAAAPGKVGATTGRSMTVGEMLDRAEAVLGKRFRGQPLVEATVRVAFAQSYLELAEHDRAERNAARAVELRGRQLGPEHPETLEALDLQASILMTAGWDYIRPKAEAAERLFRRVLVGRRRTLGPAHPDTLWTQAHLAITISNLGRHQEGEALAEQAADLAADGPNIEVAVDTRHIVGLIASRRGDLAKAEPLIREGRIRREQIHGPLHHQTLCGIIDLAEVLRLQGRLDEARDVQLEAVDRFAQAYGLCHIQTTPQMQKLVAILEQQGDPAAIRDVSQGWMRTMLATSREADPYFRNRRSIKLVENVMRVCQLPATVGFDAALALRAAEEAIALQPNWDGTRTALAFVDYRLGRLDDALRLIHTSMARPGWKVDEDLDGLLLALIHARRGEPDQARDWYDRATNKRRGTWQQEFDLLRDEAAALLGLERPQGGSGS